MGAQRYVSKELTHFVGRSLANDDGRYALVKRILQAGELRNPRESAGASLIAAAGVASGLAGRYSIREDGKLSDDDLYFLSAVCFCDIPAKDFAIHMSKYGRVGLAFDKAFLINCGARPVWYLPKGTRPAPFASDPGGSSIAESFDRLVPQIIKRYGSGLARLALGPLSGQQGQINPQSPTPEQAALLKGVEELTFLLSEVFGFIKFFDAATAETDPTNYYMEREWRCLTNVSFSLSELKRVVLPASLAERFRADFAEYQGEVLTV